LALNVVTSIVHMIQLKTNVFRLQCSQKRHN
jgi:hypothetical protein